MTMMGRPRRSKRSVSRPAHLRGPADEGDHGDPGTRYRRGYARSHVFGSPEQVILRVSEGMEGWAANRKGRPQSVSEALQFVRWSPVMPTTGGDEELVVGEGAPEEFRMRIQLYHPEGQVPGRRATGRSVFDWLVVKQSELPGAGWGLFADRHFTPGALITAYAGILSRRGGDTSRKVEFQGAFIDVPTGTKKLYLGAHFANDPYWGMSPQ